jgi:hypothetical protein
MKQYNVYHLRFDNSSLITSEMRTIGTGSFEYLIVNRKNVENKIIEMLEEDHFVIQYQNCYKKVEYPKTGKITSRVIKTICENWINNELRLEKLKAIPND